MRRRLLGSPETEIDHESFIRSVDNVMTETEGRIQAALRSKFRRALAPFSVDPSSHANTPPPSPPSSPPEPTSDKISEEEARSLFLHLLNEGMSLEDLQNQEQPTSIHHSESPARSPLEMTPPELNPESKARIKERKQQKDPLSAGIEDAKNVLLDSSSNPEMISQIIDQLRGLIAQAEKEPALAYLAVILRKMLRLLELLEGESELTNEEKGQLLLIERETEIAMYFHWGQFSEISTSASKLLSAMPNEIPKWLRKLYTDFNNLPPEFQSKLPNCSEFLRGSKTENPEIFNNPEKVVLYSYQDEISDLIEAMTDVFPYDNEKIFDLQNKVSNYVKCLEDTPGISDQVKAHAEILEELLGNIANANGILLSIQRREERKKMKAGHIKSVLTTENRKNVVAFKDFIRIIEGEYGMSPQTHSKLKKRSELRGESINTQN